MKTTVTEGTMQAVAESTTESIEGAPVPARMTSETEADRIRRQLHLRRKTKLARQALMARRTR